MIWLRYAIPQSVSARCAEKERGGRLLPSLPRVHGARNRGIGGAARSHPSDGVSSSRDRGGPSWRRMRTGLPGASSSAISIMGAEQPVLSFSLVTRHSRRLMRYLSERRRACGVMAKSLARCSGKSPYARHVDAQAAGRRSPDAGYGCCGLIPVPTVMRTDLRCRARARSATWRRRFRRQSAGVSCRTMGLHRNWCHHRPTIYPAPPRRLPDRRPISGVAASDPF
jgi:hypothetical protein